MYKNTSKSKSVKKICFSKKKVLKYLETFPKLRFHPTLSMLIIAKVEKSEGKDTKIVE